MDFDAGLLLFLFIFFVLPLIQRALGRAKRAPPQGGPPGQRRPGVPPGRPQEHARLPDDSRTGTPGRSEAGDPVRTESERAADLIPDDLWQILTGERRSRSPSQSQRKPTSESELDAEAEWGRDADVVWEPEETAAQVPDPYEEKPHQDPSPLEAPRRREREEMARTTATPVPAPITASERVSSPATTAPPSPYAIADTVAARPSRAQPHTTDARRRRTPRSLSNRTDLKRAFVWREVLGPPKALE